VKFAGLISSEGVRVLEGGLTLVTRYVKDFAGLGVILLNPRDEV
jgi:hypothetical protein